MYKMKKSYYYLERGFPENLEPAFTNQSTKRKRLLVERKKKILKRAVRRGLRTLVRPFFSLSTKKGILLDKSDLFPQSLVTQVRQENLERKYPSSLYFSQCEKRKEAREKIFFLQGRENEKQGKCRRYKFLFPLHRLKGELSKRESQYGKIELYKKQIQERKKLAFIYGAISKNSIKKLVKEARILSSSENPPAKALVTLLESRLDVALFRASFFPSISMARQWISHNKVAINKENIRAPGYQLKGGDYIEVSPMWAPLLKKKILQRMGKILPFRRSRKKVVTPSLIDNWCSFEKIFPREKFSLQNQKTTWMSTFFSESKKQFHSHSSFLSHFIKKQERQLECDFETSSQNYKINGDKITINPNLMQNFSLMRNHLQSIWEKSILSARSFSNFVGERRGKKKSHLNQKFSSSLRTNSETTFPVSRLGGSSTRKSKEIDQKGIFDKKWQRGIASTYKRNGNSPKANFLLQKGVILFARLKKKEVATLDFLNAKKTLIRPRNRAQKLAGLQVSASKPLHLEISYRLLTIVFLYSPQKVGYSGNLDFSLIMRSFK